MSLGFPLALLGLVALLVPLAIHLLQRGHEDTVEIATTQFVPIEQRPEWRWSRLREPWLWMLRSLLLLAAVIVLAEPFTTQRPESANGQSDTLVSPQVDAATARVLAGDDTTLRWLAPGLPALDEPPPPWQPGLLWGQLWQADQTLPATRRLRVIAPPVSGELGGHRPTLSREIEWIDAPTASVVSAPPITLSVVHDAARAPDAAQIMRIARAWQAAGLMVQLRSVEPANVAPQTSHVLWLSEQPWSQALAMDAPGVIVTDAVQASLPGRVLQRDTRGTPAVIESVDGARTVRRFDYVLGADSAEVNAPEFALTLAQVALPLLTRPPADLVVDAKTLQPQLGALDTPSRRRTLDHTWIIIVLILAALERAVAAIPARGANA